MITPHRWKYACSLVGGVNRVLLVGTGVETGSKCGMDHVRLKKNNRGAERDKGPVVSRIRRRHRCGIDHVRLEEKEKKSRSRKG